MNTKIYYTALEVSEMLDISRSGAYTLVKSLNKELQANGYITVPGKISVAYFNKKWYGLSQVQPNICNEQYIASN